MKGRLVETRRHALVRQVLVLLRHTFHNSQHSAHAVYMFHNVVNNVEKFHIPQLLPLVVSFAFHSHWSGRSQVLLAVWRSIFILVERIVRGERGVV